MYSKCIENCLNLIYQNDIIIAFDVNVQHNCRAYQDIPNCIQIFLA